MTPGAKLRALIHDRVARSRAELTRDPQSAARADDAACAERMLAALEPLSDDQLVDFDAARDIATRQIDEILGLDVDDMIDQVGGGPRCDPDGSVWVVLRVRVSADEIAKHRAEILEQQGC